MSLPILPHCTVLRHLTAGRTVKAIHLVRKLYGATEVEAATYVGLYLP